LVFGLNRLGVNIHTSARVQVDGIDTDKEMFENAHMGRGGSYRIERFIYENSMCVFIGRRHV